MTSMRNLNQEKTSICERVQLLSQKISAMPVSKPSDIARRYELMEDACDELEKQLDDFRAHSDQKMMDMRHMTNKIAKELKKDQSSLDTLIRQEIANANERMMLLIEQQHDSRKESDAHLMGFIEEETNYLRQAIDIESSTRDEQGSSIRQSLNADIAEIRRALQQTILQINERTSKAQAGLFQRTDAITTQLREICQTSSDNEAEFYKMLRDLVKKVKAELQEHQHKREETQSQILGLIEKMCDRAITEKTA